MLSATYRTRRNELETYFDRTAAEAWKKLMSDAPLRGVRATVRAGRDAMRALLLSRLPADLAGVRILDAGCGAGQLAFEAARRGADVVAVDLAESLLQLARSRAEAEALKGRVEFRAGDMLDPALGRFDFVVCMDSLIHYETADLLRALGALAARTEHGVYFTVAPKTPLLSAMHAVGRFFPKGDRAPAIVPVEARALRNGVDREKTFAGWSVARIETVASGFYTSSAVDLVRNEN